MMRNHLASVLRAAVMGVTIATLTVPVANAQTTLGPTTPLSSPAEPTSTITSTEPTGTTTPAPTGTTTPTTPAPTSKPTPTTTSRPTGTTTTRPEPPFKNGIFLLEDEAGVLYVVVGCTAGKPTEVHSDALDIDPLEQAPADERIWGAIAYLREDATVGHHTLSARCGGQLLTFDFELKDIVPSPTTPGATTARYGHARRGRGRQEQGRDQEEGQRQADQVPAEAS